MESAELSRLKGNTQNSSFGEYEMSLYVPLGVTAQRWGRRVLPQPFWVAESNQKDKRSDMILFLSARELRLKDEPIHSLHFGLEG